MKSRLLPVLVLGLLATATVCCQTETTGTVAGAEAKVYNGAGRITKILPDGEHTKILHGDIEGLMVAMEMSFPLSDSLGPVEISAGDSIHFSLQSSLDGEFKIVKFNLIRE